MNYSVIQKLNHMKKLFFIIVLVCTTGILMAQHIDIATQYGTSNNSVVTQVFNGTGTTLDGNEAYILQQGTENMSTVFQDNNGYGGSAEYAYVQQTGLENIANVDQTNDGHDAFIFSTGDYNEAITTQRGNKNYAFTAQLGTNNFAHILTWGVTNTSEIYQMGLTNMAEQLIGTEWNNSVLNSRLYAWQDGTENYAYQKIEGQGSPGFIVNLGNQGDIYQTGTYNEGYQRMYNGFGDLQNNTAFLLQQGDYNGSWQYQRGSGNNTTHLQYGTANVSTTYQNW